MILLPIPMAPSWLFSTKLFLTHPTVIPYNIGDSQELSTLIIFMCNHYSYAKHAASAVSEFAQGYSVIGVTIIAINSNDFENARRYSGNDAMGNRSLGSLFSLSGRREPESGEDGQVYFGISLAPYRSDARELTINLGDRVEVK